MVAAMLSRAARWPCSAWPSQVDVPRRRTFLSAGRGGHHRRLRALTMVDQPDIKVKWPLAAGWSRTLAPRPPYARGLDRGDARPAWLRPLLSTTPNLTWKGSGRRTERPWQLCGCHSRDVPTVAHLSAATSRRQLARVSTDKIWLTVGVWRLALPSNAWGPCC